MMKINVQDQTGTQLAGWKYWIAIGVLVGGLTSVGSTFPDYTPLSLYNAYQSDCGVANG
jgi:hypothetical protein